MTGNGGMGSMAWKGGLAREVLRLAAQALAVGVGVSLVLALAAFIVASQVRATPGEEAAAGVPATGAGSARAPRS